MDMEILSRPHATGKGNWNAVNKQNLCPICEQHDNCKISQDGGAVWCGREPDGSIRENQGGQYLHILGDGHQVRQYIHHGYRRKPKPKPTINWQSRSEALAAGADHHVEQLATSLGVPSWSLSDLGVGYGQLNGSDCWSFPERNSDGVVIGISRRLVKPTADGKNKIFARGGSRGLTYTADWSSRPGPILLVEGGSDTAALGAMGLAVIGRPSNCGGVDYLVQLLEGHTDRKIIVIGERDKNFRGQWPGKDGAISTAQQLSQRLGRDVSWALPGNDQKDSRTWLNAMGPKAVTKARNDRPMGLLGQLFVSSLKVGERITEPNQPDDDGSHVEPYKPPAGELVELDHWREQMQTARVESLESPGLYFDASPTGSGKTFADRAAMKSAGQSLVVLPTHSNCHELSRDLVDDGFNAAAYPKMTADNCQNWQQTQAARAAGLSPGATVCIGCAFRDGCEYIDQTKKAVDADHLVVTHARGERQKNIFKGRQFVAIHEAADNMLRPTEAIAASDLGPIAQVAWEAKDREQNKPDGCDMDVIEFCDALKDAADNLDAATRAATTTTQIKLSPGMPPPDWWEKKLWRAIRSLVTSSEGVKTFEIEGAALRLVVGLVTGELHSLTIQIDRPLGKGGAEQTIKKLVGVWKTELPDGVPVWISDATGRAAQVEKLTGRSVIDATPKGRLANEVPSVQLPVDITRRTSDHAVAGWLMGVLAKYPDAVKVGVIGHSNHIRSLFDAELLDAGTRAKILRSAYFGEGPDRASNDWQRCDLLVILGTPRVGVPDVRRRLIQSDQIDAASDPENGSWGDRRWEGQSTDGSKVVVTGRGYADPVWKEAAADQVAAGLLQAVGRGRGILTGGVPTVVLSTEPIGLPILPINKVIYVPKSAQRAVDVVNSHVCDSPKLKRVFSKNANMTTVEVAAVMGVDKSNAHRGLKQAADLGLIERSPNWKGGWGLPGSFTQGGDVCRQTKQLNDVPSNCDPPAQTVGEQASEGVPAASPAKPITPKPTAESITEGPQGPPSSAPVSNAVVPSVGTPPGAEVATVSTDASLPPGSSPGQSDQTDEMELLEERAAILQFDGGLTRAEADAMVGLSDVLLSKPPPDHPVIQLDFPYAIGYTPAFARPIIPMVAIPTDVVLGLST